MAISFQSIDTALLLIINQSCANRIFDVVMPFLSSHGYFLVFPFLLFLGIMSGIRKNDQNKTYLLSALATALICFLAVSFAEFADHHLKQLIGRVRPCRAVEGIRMIAACPKSFSMPSGHATSSFALAVPLFWRSRKFLSLNWRLIPITLASLISFSRIYLGVHYPSDVLAGAFLGSGIGFMLSFTFHWLMGNTEAAGKTGGK